MGPLEIPALGMEPCNSTTSSIDARLVSPSASALSLTKMPARAHADRPFEVELAARGFDARAGAAFTVASWISTHALLLIVVKVPEQTCRMITLSVTARPSVSGSGWIARALVSPAVWAEAASVTVASLTLAGRQPLLWDCFPATLQVGFNHAPAPAGAVFDAACRGDVAALLDALDAGGSTEEAERLDEVRFDVKEDHFRLTMPQIKCQN